ncbi:hypothetical protein PFISCL1PPCAC_19574, partial [Pristionchus fissidentatus]
FSDMSDVPVDANAGCPGTESGQAGKSSACAGCPGQASCASGQGPPKPDVSAVIDRLSEVKHKILVMSGKGGVGKSSVTTSLALALATDPKVQVAVLDIDLCGPSIPRMLGVEEEGVHQSADGWTPVGVKDNLCVMSIAFLLDNKNDAVIWRGPRKAAIIKQFLSDVNWGEIDYLLIDTPPGTSDEHISSVQILMGAGSVDGAVLVTSPQEIALLDVRKEISFCRKTNLPVIGVVENMSGFACPHCKECSDLFPSTTGGATKMCEEFSIPLLEKLPLDPRLAKCLDEGEDFFEKNGDSSLAQSLLSLATKIKQLVQ